MLRVERHPLGPRVFILGQRIHEWHLGVLVIVAAPVAAILDTLGPGSAFVAVLLGVWLVVKDWPDLTRSGRDSAGWRIGIHRRPFPLRPMRRLDDIPAVAAFATAAVALVDLMSAVTPNVSWRGRELVHLEPVSVMRNAHALAVPASAALLLTAYYLYRRRARALQLAITLLLALTVFDVLKGLDFEEATVTLGCALLLWLSRSSFSARHEPGTFRAALIQVPMLAVASFFAALTVVALAAPSKESTLAIVRETGDLLLWQAGPFGFHDELARTGLAVELISILAVLTAAYVLFRPLAAPRDLPDLELRRAAADIVHEHGNDTLSFFKLRADKHYLFDPSRRAFVGYRAESGVLMISGDPVGEPAAVSALMRSIVEFSEARSLRIAALGVSSVGRALFEQAGLRALYLGDEAIIDTAQFSVEGRGIRKVRQSVTRLEKCGFEARLAELGELDERAVAELEEVGNDWRRGAPERGFSMAMDSLRNTLCSKTLVLCATDPSGEVGGFLQFVPTYGRDAVSLSLMRRRHDTPNGLTEFMIVKAIEALRERGVTEVSLNFAAFARLFREPEGKLERTAGRVMALGDTWFQLERLYRFNAKFFPRWEPRYFMYERRFGLPRAGIAALWLEGQLPKPALRSTRRVA
ncbi:MAG TPA: phosphatidylglycerol lysyltransferase domain-containing protein [Gaiellaceae bacterium]|nr:phosphatidylglycerol lysyltransferase domain-containing protein [Gaiellaceae bacterium]